jgi:hypothetical protein
MRCLNALIFIIFLGVLLFKSAESQDIITPLQNSSQELPKETLKSKYRIQILETTPDNVDEVRNLEKEFTAKFRQNAYIVSKGDHIQLHTGDYSDKSFAKVKLPYLKKSFTKATIVKSANESIIEYSIYEPKKPAKNNSAIVPADNQINDDVKRTAENHLVEFTAWDDPKYLAANSAKDEDYLTDVEKDVYYFLNLARMNPKLFADTFLNHLKVSDNHYESSLYSELQELEPLPVLKPNRNLYESAECHAKESGERGYVGHERFKCKESFMGECCYYGETDALGIIIALLVDQGIESLGHRRICLDGGYTELGVSIQPHKTYGENCVMDFR